MITPDWLSDELNILQTHKDLQESILRDITRRILKTDLTVTDTAAWQAEKLQQCGMLYDDIIKEISKRTKMSEAETRQAFKDAETEVFNYDDEVLEKAGYFPKEFKTLSPAMMKVLSAAYKKTRKEIKNLTGTTAVTSQTAFIKACDLAHMQIVSGAFTYQEAIRNAIKSAAADGITVIYPSGYKSSLDAAVRRAVLTGTSQTTGKLVEMRADDMQVDIMEISAHVGARPDHAKWQGKLVSRSGKPGYLSLKDIGYGDVKGFLGANCRHTWFLFFVGISKRNYTDEQLERLNNQTVIYNGEKLLVWQARDKQRALERSIRVTKQELVMQDEALKYLAGNDKAIMQLEFEKNAVKLKGKEAKLKDFCAQTGLDRDKFREQVFATGTENGIKNWGKSVSQKAVYANKRMVDIYTKYLYNKDGTIIVTDNWIEKQVHKLPIKYKPFAVIETREIKGDYQQYNLTYYDNKGRMCKQIHGGHHSMPKMHKFSANGEHQHLYRYNSKDKIAWRKTKKLNKKERKECNFIL